jgi:mannose-6-phosphate isomerase-like protein (cupin superfamily)
MKKRHVSIIFPKNKSMGYRNWGIEKLLVAIPKILTLKLLFLKKRKRGGLQYHHKKNECGYILSGKLKIRFDDGRGKLKSKILKSGDCFHFPPGAIHQEEAITDCKIIEASTPYFNDRVRVENRYGIKIKGGLPSTKMSEVKKFK